MISQHDQYLDYRIKSIKYGKTDKTLGNYLFWLSRDLLSDYSGAILGYYLVYFGINLSLFIFFATNRIKSVKKLW